MGIVTDKQKILEAISKLPDDTSLEAAIQRLCFIAKIKEGLRQDDSGKTVTHEEAKRRLTR